jgi:hypothetical protein
MRTRPDSRQNATGYVAMPLHYINGTTKYAVVAEDGTIIAIRRTMNAAMRDAHQRNVIREARNANPT